MMIIQVLSNFLPFNRLLLLVAVIDDLCRDRKRIVEEFGEDVAEDVSTIAGGISKLKYEMQTDKPLTAFEGLSA